MKINWGGGVVIAFVLFAGFILFFAYLVQTDKKYDNELVVEKYYQEEQKFENKHQKEENAANLNEKISIKSTAAGVEINFPKTENSSKISGKVSLYRPDNQKLDFEIPISISDSYLLIPKNSLVTGRWDISVDWNYDEKEYLYTQKLTIL